MWAMVGLPVVFHGGIAAWRLAAWGAVYVLFAIALVRSAAKGLVLLAFEVACVVAMVLLLCDGFEGALIVLVALQLGARVPWTIGVACVVVATALLAIAVGIHWTPGAAALLAPPYLGFSLLALAAARLLEKQRAARAVAHENSRLAERLRISRELHDLVGHRMTALTLNLEVASRLAGDREAVREPIDTARAVAKGLLARRARGGDGAPR